MDPSYSDIEFFDFNNASEEEIKEIQTILKSPGANGSVELPWEIPLKDNNVEPLPQNEGEKVEPLGAMVGQALLYATPQTPVARLPEAFVPPYFVSRSLPYLRAYPHMPFFACPMPGEFVAVEETKPRRRPKKKAHCEGENSPVPSTFGYPLPYTQPPSMYYVPVFPYPPGAPVVLPLNLRPVEGATKLPDTNCEPTTEDSAKSISPDCTSEANAEDFYKCQSASEASQSRCWADLFKKQCTEINGIDPQPVGNLNKDVSNGYSVPTSEDIL